MCGYGSGKTILFGEHLVVHGEPALVMSLPLRTRVDLVPFAGTFIVDKRPKHPGFVSSKQHLYEGMAQTIANLFGVGKQYSFKISGDLPVTSGGIGASAAAGVGITRALQAATQATLSQEEMINIALAGERVIHGNPSGIDTMAAMREGIFVFRKNSHLPGPLIPSDCGSNSIEGLLLVDSQQLTTTKETVAHVALVREQQPVLWQEILTEYNKIFTDALSVLPQGNLKQLGLLFERNQVLLERLNLSCCHVDRVRNCAQQFGALGSKMTGSCRGGLVLVLGRDNEHAMQMRRVFEQKGYFVVHF